jgi:hypothetical protein
MKICPLCKNKFLFLAGLKKHLKISECGTKAKKESPRTIAKMIRDDDGYSAGNAIAVLTIFNEFSDNDYSSVIEDFSGGGGGGFSGGGASGSFESDSSSSGSSSDSGGSDGGGGSD